MSNADQLQNMCNMYKVCALSRNKKININQSAHMSQLTHAEVVKL